jgi:hypothetical protein
MPVHPTVQKFRPANWDEADAALLELGRLDERYTALKEGLAAFAERHRADFGEDLSRRLLHGRLGWKSRTRRVIKDRDATITLLRNSPFRAAIVQDIDFTALAGATPAELAALGIREKCEESFFVEPARALPAT